MSNITNYNVIIKNYIYTLKEYMLIQKDIEKSLCYFITNYKQFFNIGNEDEKHSCINNYDCICSDNLKFILEIYFIIEVIKNNYSNKYNRLNYKLNFDLPNIRNIIESCTNKNSIEYIIAIDVKNYILDIQSNNSNKNKKYVENKLIYFVNIFYNKIESCSTILNVVIISKYLLLNNINNKLDFNHSLMISKNFINNYVIYSNLDGDITKYILNNDNFNKSRQYFISTNNIKIDNNVFENALFNFYNHLIFELELNTTNNIYNNKVNSTDNINKFINNIKVESVKNKLFNKYKKILKVNGLYKQTKDITDVINTKDLNYKQDYSFNYYLSKSNKLSDVINSKIKSYIKRLLLVSNRSIKNEYNYLKKINEGDILGKIYSILISKNFIVLMIILKIFFLIKNLLNKSNLNLIHLFKLKLMFKIISNNYYFNVTKNVLVSFYKLIILN